MEDAIIITKYDIGDCVEIEHLGYVSRFVIVEIHVSVLSDDDGNVFSEIKYGLSHQTPEGVEFILAPQSKIIGLYNSNFI